MLTRNNLAIKMKKISNITNDEEYHYSLFRIFCWIVAVIISCTIWYNIAYYAYQLYKLTQKDTRIEFRVNPKLMKPTNNFCI